MNGISDEKIVTFATSKLGGIRAILDMPLNVPVDSDVRTLAMALCEKLDMIAAMAKARIPK